LYTITAVHSSVYGNFQFVLSVSITGYVIAAEPLAIGSRSNIGPVVTSYMSGNYYCNDCQTPAIWEWTINEGECANMHTQSRDSNGGLTDVNNGSTWNVYCDEYSGDSTFYFDDIGNIYSGEPVDGSDMLSPGDTLAPNTSLASQSGRYRLQYQTDGNLVLVDTSTDPWTPLWASGTNDNNPGFVVMQPDGNLSIYNGSGSVVWSTDTARSDNAYLLVQNDGNVVLYDADDNPLWATDTVQGPGPLAHRPLVVSELFSRAASRLIHALQRH
jgi:hypothetical protein